MSRNDWQTRAAKIALAIAPIRLLDPLRHLAERNQTARRVIRRVTGAFRTGVHTVRRGPASGLLIDVAGSRPSYILGTAEPDVQAFLAEHLRPGDTFFDLGANIGYFSLVGAALVGPTGRVVSFEPSPVNAMALRRNLELNGLVNVEVVEAAVSDTEGVASFDPTDDDQSGRLAEGPASVRTVTIDAEVARTGWSPSLLKVDIEGAEEAALRGMHETLLTHHPVILCEVHALPDLSGPLATSLRDLGYEVRWLEGDIDGTGFWAPHLLAFPS